MKDVLKTFNVTSSSCWLWVIISIIVHLGSISLQLQGVCAACRQALSCNVVQEQLSYSSTCLDVVVEWKSWVRVESNGVEWKSWIRIDSINTTLYQPVTMPAAIGDQQLYNKEPLHTKALLLPRESQQRSWAPRLPLSLPQLPPLSNGGDNAALQGCGDFSVHVSNALLTWKELCKYNDFYSCIRIFDSRGIAGYTMGFFYLFCMTLVILLKPFEEHKQMWYVSSRSRSAAFAEGSGRRCTLRFLCALWLFRANGGLSRTDHCRIWFPMGKYC